MDLIDRQAAIDAIKTWGLIDGLSEGQAIEILADEEKLPSAQSQGIIRCKDCKHWRDSDGVYRRGTDAESKCPLNTQEVYAGTFYCGYAERRQRDTSD